MEVRPEIKTLEETAKYLKTGKSTLWLLEGARKGRHISTRTVQAIFRQALRKAGINNNVTVYSQRHCCATHLLESGVDIRDIQEIPGRKNSKTTEIHTRVSRASLANIENPIDREMKK